MVKMKKDIEQNKEEPKVTKEEVKSAVKVSGKDLIKRMPEMPVFRFFLNSDSAIKVFLKSILMLLIPYGYLFFMGFVFDLLLAWYFMTEFIFVSLIVFWVIAIIYIVWAWRRYFTMKNGAKPNRAQRRERTQRREAAQRKQAEANE